MAVEIPATVILNNVEIEGQTDVYVPVITTDDYSALSNKPSINGVVLIGDKSSHDLHLADLDDIYNFYPTDTAQGAVASFSDGAESVPVKSLSVSIDPVQDLHGYESPWVAGGGVNQIGFTDGTYTGMSNRSLTVANGLITVTATGAVSSAIVVDATRLASSSTDRQYAAGTYVFSLYNWAGTVTGATRNNMRITIEYGDETTEDVAVDTPFTTASAWKVRAIKASSTLQWTNGAYIAFRFVLAKGSTVPSDWTPYTNICPISGHSTAVVTRCGKNLLDPDLLVGYYDTADGSFVSASNFRASKKMKCHPSTTYVMSGSTHSTGGYSGRSLFWDAKGNYLGNVGTGTNFTSLANAVEMAIYTSSATATGTMQIEQGSVATTYEPYNPQTYTIDLDGTRYGGTLDVTTGVLTVDRTLVDLATLTWTYYETGGHNTFNVGNASAVYDSEPICEKYWFEPTVHTISAQENGSLIYYKDGNGKVRISIRDDRYTSASAFVAGIGSTLYVYYRTEPQTVQLTETEVRTLLGDNNIFCSTGDVDVTYRADMGLFIRKVIGGG